MRRLCCGCYGRGSQRRRRIVVFARGCASSTSGDNAPVWLTGTARPVLTQVHGAPTTVTLAFLLYTFEAKNWKKSQGVSLGAENGGLAGRWCVAIGALLSCASDGECLISIWPTTAGIVVFPVKGPKSSIAKRRSWFDPGIPKDWRVSRPQSCLVEGQVKSAILRNNEEARYYVVGVS